jgi:hypothetical protein
MHMLCAEICRYDPNWFKNGKKVISQEDILVHTYIHTYIHTYVYDIPQLLLVSAETDFVLCGDKLRPEERLTIRI